MANPRHPATPSGLPSASGPARCLVSRASGQQRRNGVVFHNALDSAVEQGLLASNPVDKTRWRPGDCLTRDGRHVAEIRNTVAGLLEDLPDSEDRLGARLQEAIVLYTGVHTYSRDDWIKVLPLDRLWVAGDVREPLGPLTRTPSA